MSFLFRAAGVALALLTAATVFAQKSTRLPNYDIRAQRGGPQVRGLAEAAEAKRAALEAKLAPIAAEASGPLRLTTDGTGGLRTLAARGGFLTGPDGRDGLVIARDYLAAHADLLGFDAAQAAALRSVSRRPTRSFEVLTFEQRLGDVPVYGGRVRIAVASDGRILQVESGEVDAGMRLAAPATISASQAVMRAFAAAGFEEQVETAGAEVAPLGRSIPGWELYASPLGPNARPVPVQQTVFPTAVGLGRAAWVVHVAGPRSAAEVVVAADDGELLLRADLTAEIGSADYWPQSPDDGAQVPINFPDGWLPAGRTVTTGNNTDAFLDRDDDNRPDPIDGDGLMGGRSFSDSQNFSFPGGDGRGNHLATGASSVLHAWIYANQAHDYFYELGFDEAAGNFQTDNFGRGGVGDDAVVMNIQDPGIIGNAFFATAPEGMPPLTAYGLFFLDSTGDDVRDSALDGMVVIHEIGHGLTTRVVGGSDRVSCLFTLQSGSLGEGWSDYFAMSFYNDPLVGSYSTGNLQRGIRRHPYDNTPLTFARFGDTNFSSPHPDGEIWAAALWDLRTAIGAEAADALVYEALEITPCNPSFTDARDSILTADQAANAGANRAAIWTAFAARGLGFSAEGLGFNPFSGDQYLTLALAAFDIPPDLGRENAPPRITSRPSEFASVGRQVRYRVTAFDSDGDAVTIEPVDLPDGATWNAEQNEMIWTANFTGQRFVFRATDARGSSTTQIFFYLSGAALDLGSSVVIDGDEGSIGSLFVRVPQGLEFLRFTLRGGEGDPDLVIIPPLDEPAVSDSFSTDETLTFINPAAGLWFGQVEGFEEYSGVTLLADRLTPTELSLPGSAGPISGLEGEQFVFKITIPEAPAPAQGTAPERLRVQTRGTVGDADLSLTRDLLASCQESLLGDCDFDEESFSFTSFEAVEIESPEPGDYFAVVEAFDDFEGLTVEATTQTTAARSTAVTEGADFAELLAPGGISTLFGENLTDGASIEADSLPLPTELGGLEVIVDGVPAGLFFVGPGQVNFQNPFEPGTGSSEFILLRDGLVTEAISAVTVADVPRMFGFFEGEARLPVVVHAADNSVVTSANPAQPGESLVAYLSGVGSLENAPASRTAALGDPLTRTTAVPTVTVGGREAVTLFSGWTPGFVGLVQVNFTLDAGTPTGGLAPMKMDFAGEETQTLGLPVDAP